MTKKEDRLTITVGTAPNGYTLDLTSGQEHRGYLYFSTEDLIDGFVYHAGLREMVPSEKHYMKRTLRALSKWSDIGDLVKKLLSQEEKIQAEKDNILSLKKTLEAKAARISRLVTQNTVLREKVKEYERMGRRQRQRK